MRGRSAAFALLASAAAPAFALAPEAPVTAERAMEIQKDSVRDAVGTLPCRRDGAGGDIIVCGRRGPDPNRVPFPDQRTPGEPENVLPGELARAQPSFGTCEFGCQQPVTITDKDVRKYGGRILRHILGKDD
ncbi:MAG TPA: hypothetical protein VGB57_12350 [Allosphingosinicella sp.]|jgi:hypothetical protein